MLLRNSVLLPVILLVGCVSTTVPETIPLILPWPTPMSECEITTVSITPEGNIQMSYQDNINIAVCERDMFRYIKDLHTIICQHQPTDKECND